MRIKTGFMLREIASNYIVVPVGKKTIDFNGIITLNNTGAYIWGLLENESTLELVEKALVKKYKAPSSELKRDLDEFIQKLKDHDLLEM